MMGIINRIVNKIKEEVGSRLRRALCYLGTLQREHMQMLNK